MGKENHENTKYVKTNCRLFVVFFGVRICCSGKQIEAHKSGNSHCPRSAAWNIAQFAPPPSPQKHGVDVCPEKTGQEWQLAWGLLSTTVASIRIGRAGTFQDAVNYGAT